MEAGLNLFSLRTLLQSEEGFLDTAARLRDMGYSYLQFSGCPYDAGMIERVSKQTGMPIVLTHVPMSRIINEPEALMEEHEGFGCRRIGLGCIPPKMYADEKQVKEAIEALERSAEKMAENGFSFFYHNHHFEFYKYGGQTVFDYMIENAPHFNFTLDTYWLQYGGVDVLDFARRLTGRIECVHLKDYLVGAPLDPSKDFALSPRFAPVGDGNMDFKKIIPELKALGTKYFIVEQDNAVDFSDPLEQVGRSIKYLREEL